MNTEKTDPGMSKNLMLTSLLAAVVLLTSCQAIKEMSDEIKLDDLLKMYEENLRWGSLSNSYNFLGADLREQTPVPENLEMVKVTKVRRLTPVAHISQSSATLTISIDYVFEDEQVERTLVDEQVWAQQDESGEWFRANSIPRFE
jgi:hypothetical protein